MSLIKIIANGIEIDYVASTLQIRKDNNALIKSFKVSHNSFPFLIIENKNAKQALGTRELTSINKKKVVQVTVYENEFAYYGELEIISYLDGFRKCNLKYGSELIGIMNKKIAEFMPVVSITGSETFPDYIEETDTVIDNYEDWPDYVASHQAKIFPEVKWQFPLMNYKNKFGENLESTDDWYLYQNIINNINAETNELVINDYEDMGSSGYNVYNRNVIAPQIFLLSPLFYALKSVNFKMKGNFTTHELIRRILFLSFKDNLTKVNLTPDVITVDLDTPNFIEIPDIYNPGTLMPYTPGQTTFVKLVSIPITSAGEYVVNFRFELRGDHPFYSYACHLIINPPGGDNTLLVFQKSIITDHVVIEGSYTVTASTAGNIIVKYGNKYEQMPYEYTLTIQKNEKKIFYEMHPTIQTGRFLPDWNLSTYINQLKLWFNLDLDIDDFTKTFSLNFNEDFIENSKPEIVKKSLAISNYEKSLFEAFLLRFENDIDSGLWITRTDQEVFTNQNSDYLEEIKTKFKIVPITNTAELSEDLDSKEGTGLMIYNEINYPFISSSYNEMNLSAQSIYSNFHKNWLKFRANAGIVEMTGTFTKTEISKITKAKRIHIDHQEYILEFIESKELKNENYEVKFRLHSITI